MKAFVGHPYNYEDSEIMTFINGILDGSHPGIFYDWLKQENRENEFWYYMYLFLTSYDFDGYVYKSVKEVTSDIHTPLEALKKLHIDAFVLLIINYENNETPILYMGEDGLIRINT